MDAFIPMGDKMSLSSPAVRPTRCLSFPFNEHNRAESFPPPVVNECIFGVVGDSQWESLLGDGVKAAAVEFGFG